MSKKTLSPAQKRLDTDIWIIALVTLAVFCLYAAMGNQLTQFVLDSGRPIFPRLLVNAGIQYGVAGLGITIVCILRREAFSSFGLRKEQAGKAVLGTILVFLPLLCCRYLSGQIEGWQPFSILITEDVLNSSFPLSVLGMAVIILVWGFFEGFNLRSHQRKDKPQISSCRTLAGYGRCHLRRCLSASSSLQHFLLGNR